MWGIPFLGGKKVTLYTDEELNEHYSYLWELDYAFEFADEEREFLYKAWDCRRKGP